MKEVKLLNLANVPKISFIKAIHDIKKISLKDAKEMGDAVYNGNAVERWYIEVEDFDLQRVKDILEGFGINYCINDLKTSSGTAPDENEMKNSGVYLEATETGIKVTIVAKIPNDSRVFLRLESFLTNAHCTVFMFDAEDHTRVETSKYFPAGVVDLNSIIEFTHGVSTIISLLVDIKNVNERIADMERKIEKAVDKISW